MIFKISKILSVLSIGGLLASVSPVVALSATAGSANASSAASQTAINHLKSRGDTEINRRLTTLNKLDGVIKSTLKLSSANKTSLTTEVNSAVSGLTTLKTKLDSDTDLATTRTDTQTIVSDYRVYALVTPKVYLLKTADGELINDTKLASLAAKLQIRVANAKNNGKDVTSLQTSLDDMNAQISVAQGIANAVNAKVVPLQPTDYNSDHAILESQRDQLKTAHQDNTAAYNDAKAIVSALKYL